MPGTMTRTSHQHTMEEIAEFLRDDGRLWGYWGSINFLATMWGESGGNAFAMPVVVNPDSKAHLSIDVGICQINSYWQSHRYDRLEELLDARTNVTVALDIAFSNDEPAWRPTLIWWNIYKKAMHKVHVGQARRAINKVRARYGEKAL